MSRALWLAIAAVFVASACETVPVETVAAAPPAPVAPDTSLAPRAPEMGPIDPAKLTPEAVALADEFLWLENVDSKRSRDWVSDQNKKTDKVLKADARYEPFRKDALAILTAQDRVPVPSFRGDGVDNFWQDAKNVRGLWRSTSLDDFRSETPKWTTILDIDALSRRERANWIFKGVECLAPAENLCLVSLSDGGKDAVSVREFDVAKKQFVRNGFTLPEGKHRITWLNQDTLLVATDFGSGTLTESGYPFIVKALSRGQTLAQAREIFRGAKGDGGYGVEPIVYRDSAGVPLVTLVTRPLDTFRSETWDLTSGRPVKLTLPARHTLRGALGRVGGAMTRLVFTIEEPWRVNLKDQRAGALLTVNITMLRPSATLALTEGDVSAFEPTARQSIEDVAVFDDRIMATVYDNVRGRVIALSDEGQSGWQGSQLPLPENMAINLGSKARSKGLTFLTYEGFLTPSTLALASVSAANSETVKQAPSRFAADSHVVEQFQATSSDGTQVPYFLVRPKGELTGKAPTLMFGYGGFQVSYPPAYKAELGKLWLERGGAYVVANIRGGGEFGPAWHQAALKENRQRAFDDFATVAADLVRRGVTNAKQLGIYGRSNGGVLTSVTLTQHPELIGGAVIESPLVDMLRYQDLPPGASWMGEYGDPRIPEEAAYIAKYSGYQNVRTGVDYPEVYITTNTHDDRVHPGHARKFAARLQATGHAALYYEETNGGHSNDADPVLNSQRWARHYVYLSRALGL